MEEVWYVWYVWCTVSISSNLEFPPNHWIARSTQKQITDTPESRLGTSPDPCFMKSWISQPGIMGEFHSFYMPSIPSPKMTARWGYMRILMGQKWFCSCWLWTLIFELRTSSSTSMDGCVQLHFSPRNQGWHPKIGAPEPGSERVSVPHGC